ncbi:sodium-coupled monocarboxylate transporter 2-like [Amphiura filiformis]|uniref:sodium-coupled monocarboxylate transporter 2-like n=1 Tax=Amphiura filiformis TaxID=82378 RepID=UPI003B21E1C0
MVEQHNNTFTGPDYVVFVLLLCISAGIGIFHAVCGGRQKTTKEYLVADRSMSAIPVGMSLVATFMSAVTVLGSPAEIYYYGTMFWWFGLAYTIVSLLTAYVYMPVFYKLQVTSVYEYLERRFNRKVRLLGMGTFQIQMIFYMGIAIYAPALALNEVTGFPLWGAVWACGLVCTFYCTIGGLKAVIWTDVLQLSVMWIGFLLLIIKGSIEVGGISEVFRIADERGRIDFVHFEFDPRVRHTFWTINVGGGLLWLAAFGVNQAQVQRYLSCKSLRHAQGACYFNIFGLNMVLLGVVLSGLVMFARYSDCDPYTAGWVGATDQLIPYFLMDIFGDYPGLPGLFVAAIFSAALSSVSSGLNSMATTISEDIVKPYFNPQESTYTWISKGLVLGYGLLSICMAYIVSATGSEVLIIALRLFGMIGGPLLGLFSLAIFVPWCNSKGAALGLITGLAISFWVGIGGIFNPPPGVRLPVSINNCTFSNPDPTILPYASSSPPMTSPWTPEPPMERTGLQVWWYGMSYLLYSAVSVTATLLVGVITSFITGAQKPNELEPGLMSPVCDIFLCCLPEKFRRVLWCGVRHDEESTKGNTESVEGGYENKTFEEERYNENHDTKL